MPRTLFQLDSVQRAVATIQDQPRCRHFRALSISQPASFRSTVLSLSPVSWAEHQWLPARSHYHKCVTSSTTGALPHHSICPHPTRRAHCKLPTWVWSSPIFPHHPCRYPTYASIYCYRKQTTSNLEKINKLKKMLNSLGTKLALRKAGLGNISLPKTDNLFGGNSSTGGSKKGTADGGDAGFANPFANVQWGVPKAFQSWTTPPPPQDPVRKPPQIGDRAQSHAKLQFPAPDARPAIVLFLRFCGCPCRFFCLFVIHVPEILKSSIPQLTCPSSLSKEKRSKNPSPPNKTQTSHTYTHTHTHTHNLTKNLSSRTKTPPPPPHPRKPLPLHPLHRHLSLHARRHHCLALQTRRRLER